MLGGGCASLAESCPSPIFPNLWDLVTLTELTTEIRIVPTKFGIVTLMLTYKTRAIYRRTWHWVSYLAYMSDEHEDKESHLLTLASFSRSNRWCLSVSVMSSSDEIRRSTS